MKIFETFAQLFDEESSLISAQRFISLITHELKETDTAYILLDKINILGRFKMIIELADVRMAQLLHASYFSHDRLFLARVVQLILRVDFDGHSLFGCLMLRELHLCIGPLSKHSYNLVFVKLCLSNFLLFHLDLFRCLK